MDENLKVNPTAAVRDAALLVDNGPSGRRGERLCRRHPGRVRGGRP
jgi:hypothetical protein